MPTKGSPSGSRWCFTINNYTETDGDWIQEKYKAGQLKYCIMGRETAPDTGTKHLQGYCVFTTVQRLSSMKKIHATAHWEQARGSTAQNIEYCSKEGDFVEIGEKPLSSEQVGAITKKSTKRHGSSPN